jgi:hypothetical protein
MMLNLDLTRIYEFLTGAFLRLDDLIAAGDAKLSALIAEGEARVVATPELRPEWEQQRAKLEAGWAESRAALVAAKNDPAVHDRLRSGIAEAIQTVLAREGEVGKPHGHAG